MNQNISKVLAFLICCLLSISITHAQINEFEVKTDGIVIPRVDRTLVLNPTESQLIYDINSESFWYYKNSNWHELFSSISNIVDQDGDTGVDVESSVDIDEIIMTLGGIDNYAFRYKNNNAFIDILNSANTIIGNDAGLNVQAIVSGSTFLGKNAGRSVSTATFSTFIGEDAGKNITTASENVAVGYAALRDSNGAWRSVAIGTEALRESGGEYNVGVGRSAGALSSGDDNTLIGDQCGFLLTGGSGNTFLGRNAGREIRDGNNNIMIGFDSGSSSSTIDINNSIAIGNNTKVTKANQVVIGNSATTEIGGFQDWTTYSDARIKKNINDNVVGLDFINKLKPVSYNIDYHKLANLLQEDVDEDKVDESLVSARSVKSAKVDYGFIAQDVEDTLHELGIRFQGLQSPQNSDELYKLSYSSFVVPLVKSVQELSEENKALKLQLKEILQRLEDLEK